MRTRVMVLLMAAVAAMWAVDANRMAGVPGMPVTPRTESSVPEVSNRVEAPVTGDVPAGYQPSEAVPTPGPGPVAISVQDLGGPGNTPKPLWGPDQLVYDGFVSSPPYAGGRIISQDGALNGNVFAAIVRAPGDTVMLYRSTDGGMSWSRIGGILHPGNVLSSVKLVVAEGDSNFVFLFFVTSAGNGDFYAIRWNQDGTGTHIVPVKADADTIANCSGTVDKDNYYYVYGCFEQRGGAGGAYNVHTRRSMDFGLTWSDNIGDAADTRVSPTPDISYGFGGRLYMTYMDVRLSSQTDTANIRVKISSDYGTTWRQSSQVAATSVPVSNSVIGAANGPDQVIWLVHVRDLTLWNSTGLAVCYFASTDSGATWAYGGDVGIGHGNTPNNEKMPSIGISKTYDGSATVSYSVVPSESLMFTWCSPGSPTDWTQVEKVNDHRHTGNFPSSAGWKYSGSTSYSSVLYGGVGPDSVWFDGFNLPTGVVEEPAPVRSSALRVQVSPDPVRNSARVSFALPEPGAVELALYSVSGQRAAMLVQGSLPAGRHEARLDAAGLAAGVYVARLSVNGETETRRIVVLH